jgi:hypothetical protein
LVGGNRSTPKDNPKRRDKTGPKMCFIIFNKILN